MPARSNQDQAMTAAVTVCDSPAGGLLSIESAIDQLRAAAKPVDETETVPLVDANGRVLARTMRSEIDIPPWPNSSVDGYAVRCADLASAATVALPVSQRIPAGTTGGPLAAGSAARIFTGAPLPAGADTVVMQEDCIEKDRHVTFNTPATRGDGVREQGEDIHCGQEVLRQGRVLAPQDIGLAASVGLASLPVLRRLRIALLATGDELVRPGQTLKPGQIYDTNLYLLWSALHRLGCEVVSFGSVRDNLDQTRKALQQAASQSDLIISSGGVSVGEEDHVRTALSELGRLDFWRIAVKPGKPLAFGSIGETPFLGLPGNPVSAWVTFCLFGVPFIRLRQGASFTTPRPHRLAARFARNNRGPRQEYVRARVVESGIDEPAREVEIHPNQSSGAFSSVAWSDGLVKIEPDRQVNPGDPVDFYPYSAFGV